MNKSILSTIHFICKCKVYHFVLANFKMKNTEVMFDLDLYPIHLSFVFVSFNLLSHNFNDQKGHLFVVQKGSQLGLQRIFDQMESIEMTDAT